MTVTTTGSGQSVINCAVGDTITVSASGYTFTPASVAVTQGLSNVTFTGTPTTPFGPIGGLSSYLLPIGIGVVLIVVLMLGNQQ